MPTTRAFNIAQISRHVAYIEANNTIVSDLEIQSTNRGVGTATIEGTTVGDVHTFVLATYRAARYIITATNGTDYHTSHVVLQHDGTNVEVVQFASFFDNAELAAYSADISGSDVRLRATPANAGTNTFKFNVELISS